MRVFAGPNGSGKTTIIKDLQPKYRFGVYINADDIEQTLDRTDKLLFDSYQLTVDEDEIRAFFQLSQFSPIRRDEPDLWQKISIKNNTLSISTSFDSYLAADIAEFLRQEALKENLTFTYETVMSHKSKISFCREQLIKVIESTCILSQLRILK